MSLESISALRQLTQVREQSATMQNDNLEKVQGAVQQVSVSEAQRSDSLSLQAAKAEYEVALSKATMDRIQSQLEREKTSLLVTQISTVITAGFAAADTYMNLKKDFSGGQKLGTSNQGTPSAMIDEKNAKTFGDGKDFYTTDRNKTSNSTLTVENKGTIDTNKALELGLITKNSKGEISVTNKGLFNGIEIDDNKAKYNSENKFGKNSNDALVLNSQTVLRATVNGNGSVAYFNSATITQDDIRLKAQQVQAQQKSNGVDIDISGIQSFEDLYNLTDGKGNKIGKEAADQLFNENGKEIRSAEAVGAMDAFRKGLEGFKLESGTEISDSSRNLIGQSLEAKLRDEGKIDDGISAKDGAKYVFNGIISLAQTIVPQIQALMAAKEKVAQTEIELQAAIEKLAAAQKKLRQIEDLIVSVGGDNLGNANGQAETGLS